MKTVILMGKKCDETHLLADYINKILDMENALTGRSFFLQFYLLQHAIFYLSVHGSVTGVYFSNIVWLKLCYNTLQSVVHADKGIVALKWVLKSEFYSE